MGNGPLTRKGDLPSFGLVIHICMIIEGTYQFLGQGWGFHCCKCGQESACSRDAWNKSKPPRAKAVCIYIYILQRCHPLPPSLNGRGQEYDPPPLSHTCGSSAFIWLRAVAFGRLPLCMFHPAKPPPKKKEEERNTNNN